jgi:ComF family protein
MLDLVYPPICLLCNEPLRTGDADFCPKCTKALTTDPWPACPRCAATMGPHTETSGGCPACVDQKYQFDAALRLSVYEHEEVRAAVLRIKSAAGESLAYALGRLLGREQKERLRQMNAQFIVRVPLHWWRRWRRGYDQAAALAEGLARELKLPCRPAWLRRVRHTPKQTVQTPAQRRENVHDAFRARKCAEMRGATVLLVDDVLTTCSTCNEAAKALRRAGAGRICVAALARSTT